MKKIFLIAICILLSITFFSCDTNKRRPKKPIEACIEPPADVLTADVKVKLDASLPSLDSIVKSNLSLERKFQRIRAETPYLQTYEVLDYRYCRMYFNGILTKEKYTEFATFILQKMMGNDIKEIKTSDFENNPILTITPENGESFKIFPRKLNLKWNELKNAKRYIVEVQYKDIEKNQWFNLPNEMGHFSTEKTESEIEFIGAQPGRWRVYAIDEKGEESKISEWKQFFFQN